MNGFQAALTLWLAGSLHAEEGIRVLSADPADNVLLEISVGAPASLVASTDLKNWRPIFPYLPPCEDFKVYVPQVERKQTFYKLVPPLPQLLPIVLSSTVPDIKGKSYGNLDRTVSFGLGSAGTCDPVSYESFRKLNTTYAVVDSRPGMISVRSQVADGTRLDHLILTIDPDSPGNSFLGGDALVFTAERSADWLSRMWLDNWGATGDGLLLGMVYGSRAELPPTAPSWPQPEGIVIRLSQNQETITLQSAGIASISKGSSTTTAAYEYIATGGKSATLRLLRGDGTSTLAYLLFSFDNGEVFHRHPIARPYLIQATESAQIIALPPPGGG